MRLSIAVAGLVLSLAVSACFKKGSGKGTRQTRGTFADKGDIFIPGPDNKPGEPKDPDDDEDDDGDEMDPEATAILAACFDVPEEEIEPVVGWTDPAAAREAASALCDDLDEAKYNKGTIANDADAVVLAD